MIPANGSSAVTTSPSNSVVGGEGKNDGREGMELESLVGIAVDRVAVKPPPLGSDPNDGVDAVNIAGEAAEIGVGVDVVTGAFVVVLGFSRLLRSVLILSTCSHFLKIPILVG